MKNIKEMSIDEILNYSVPYNDEYVITIPDFHKLYTEKNKKSKLLKRSKEIIDNNIGNYGFNLSTTIKCKIINNKRVFCYDSKFLIFSILKSLDINLSDDIMQNDNLIEYTKDQIKIIKSKLKNIKSVDELSEILPKMYKTILDNKAAKLILTTESGIHEFIKQYEYELTKVSVNLKYLCEELEKPIEEKYFEGIDKSLLLHVISVISLDLAHEDNSINDSIYTAMKYYNENKNNIKYKDSVTYYKSPSYNGRKIPRCSYSKFIEYYKDYMNNHKYLKEEVLSNEKYSNMNVEDVQKYMELHRNKIQQEMIEKEQEELRIKKEHEEKKQLIKSIREELTVNWELCPSGTKQTETSVHCYTPKIKRGKYDNLKFQKIYEEKVKFFSNSDYVIHIFGKDKFEGYEGYIYPNGIVLFEKLTTKRSISKNTALYVMDVRNFVELSKKNKQEIIEIIGNNEEENLRRINHSKNWQVRALNVIDKKTDISLEELRNIKLYQKKI